MVIRKSMIFKRLFGINIIMITFLIVSLDMFFINKELSNNEQNILYINEKVTYDVNEQINNINNNTSLIIKNMYSDKHIVSDVIEFLDMDTVDYLKYKLDRFSSSSDYFYNGIESLTKSSFNISESLINISFVSYSRKETRSFNNLNQIKTEKNNMYELGEEYKFSSFSFDKNTISHIREIKDPITLESKGEIVLTYDLSKLESIVDKYEKSYDVMILDSKGYVVYDSEGEYEYEEYPEFKKLKEATTEIQLDKNYYINKTWNTSTLLTVVKTPKVKLSSLPKSFFNTIFFMDILLFIIVEGVLYKKLKKLSDRTDLILNAMEKVKDGNLNVSIPITNENDEINYISQSFNEMCKNLNEHIEKSYLAELNQKSAEMIALQNQINPHFLYNTLESIRMKAICNGDKEVGKMLYTLAFLFRNQLKEKNIITIRSELDYCEKYLEIFKFRYDEKFEYVVNCDEELLDKQIIKFTLQPLIENYFIHGIGFQNSDNKLEIDITSKENNIYIYIKDNGIGICEEKIESINKMLETRINTGESIGILNAHERIVMNYGNIYGIKLTNNKDKGVMVVVKLPCKGIDEDV